MHIHLLSKLHVSDSNVVCSEGDADLPHVGPDVSTDAVLQRLVYNCYKRKTNLIGLSDFTTTLIINCSNIRTLEKIRKFQLSV